MSGLVKLNIGVTATIYPVITVSEDDWKAACTRVESEGHTELKGELGGRGCRGEHLSNTEVELTLTGAPSEESDTKIWPGEFEGMTCRVSVAPKRENA